MKNEEICAYANTRVVIIRMMMILGLSAIMVLTSYIVDGETSWKYALTMLVYTFFFWEGNTAFSCLSERFFPRIIDIPKRIGVSVLFALLYTLSIVGLVNWLFYGFESNWREIFGEFIVGFFITLLVSAVYASVAFFRMYKSSLIETESLKRSRIESELKALNAQVNPHFLFNSLNTLMSLIPEDSQLALEFTKKFSDVYRYILQNKFKEMVTVKDEIEFTSSYIFLLKIRHGNNVNMELFVDDTSLLKMIPTLTLQMLVENATKHNVISEHKKLNIRIESTSDGLLTVRNNLSPKKTPENGAGIGLENIRKRYEYLTDRKVEIVQTGEEFIASLPLLETENYEVRHH